MNNSVGLPADGQHPRTRSTFALWLVAYTALLFGIGNIAVTQYLARAFEYSPALGTPIYQHLYAPWAWRQWRETFLAEHRMTFLLAFLIVGGLLLVLYIAGLVAIALAIRRTRAVSHLHGSAHWASPKEVRASGLMPLKDKKGAGVYVGGWRDPKGSLCYLRHNGPEHILAFAPTRSGKGVGLIIPTLLSWPESAVIYDLKGENWELSAGWRKKAGHLVLKFDPLDTEGLSARYNPLEEVRLGTVHEVADAQNVVNMIIDPDGKGLADHWDKTSYMFLTGVVLHTMYKARREGHSASLPDVSATLTSVTGIESLYTEMKENTFAPDGQPHTVIMRSSIDMLEKEERERGSVLSSAKTFFALYADPIVSKNISRSDFHIRDLMNAGQPVSLYLVVDPENKERLKPLVRLMITQVVRGVTPRLQFANGSPVKTYKHRLLLLLDEFPALGKLPIFQDALAHIAGYGVKAYLFTQDLSQLKQAYGDQEAITSSCHLKVAFAPNRLETAETLSKLTGTATVIKRVVTTSGKRFGLMLGQVSESLQETARPLLTPDECMRLPGAQKNAQTGLIEEAGDMLIFCAGMAPIYGRQILFFKDPVFAARAKLPAPHMSDRVAGEKPRVPV